MDPGPKNNREKQIRFDVYLFVSGKPSESVQLRSTNGCQVMSQNSLQIFPVVRCW